MAGLNELKKHLRSVQVVGQLAGAMKTISSVKYSRINALYSEYSAYADDCGDLLREFGDSAFAVAEPNPNAPDCYVIIGSNRGLCGGYNAELHTYAEEVLRAAGKPYRLIVCGKNACTHFRDKKEEIFREFVFSDVPSYEECLELCNLLQDDYLSGNIASVRIIRQKFKNMLNQTPEVLPLLPLEKSGGGSRQSDDFLFVPDRETVVSSIAEKCLDSVIYAKVLEAAAGAQAATLMAMRSAYDNAEESGAKLETELNRRRQSEVTAGVLETSSENAE